MSLITPSTAGFGLPSEVLHHRGMAAPHMASMIIDIICGTRTNSLGMLQGSEAAGSVPAELGQPDEHGVYTHNSSTGSVFLRQSHVTCHTSTWEFSTDKALWISVSHVSSIYRPSCLTISSIYLCDTALLQSVVIEHRFPLATGQQLLLATSHADPHSTAAAAKYPTAAWYQATSLVPLL